MNNLEELLLKITEVQSLTEAQSNETLKTVLQTEVKSFVKESLSNKKGKKLIKEEDENEPDYEEEIVGGDEDDMDMDTTSDMDSEDTEMEPPELDQVDDEDENVLDLTSASLEEVLEKLKELPDDTVIEIVKNPATFNVKPSNNLNEEDCEEEDEDNLTEGGYSSWNDYSDNYDDDDTDSRRENMLNRFGDEQEVENFNDEISLEEKGFEVFEDDGLYGIRDMSGDVIIEPKYTFISDMMSGHNGIIMAKDENGSKVKIDIYSHMDDSGNDSENELDEWIAEALQENVKTKLLKEYELIIEQYENKLKTLNKKHSREMNQMNEQLTAKQGESKSLKEQQLKYNSALKKSNQLLEQLAVHNTNLLHITKLFTEQTVSREEKIQIATQFDGVKTVNESKILFEALNQTLPKKSLSQKKNVQQLKEEMVSNTAKKEILKEEKTFKDPDFERFNKLVGYKI